MAIMRIEYRSEILDKENRVNIIYPDLSRVDHPDDPDIPVLYLLHGMGGTQDSWLNRTNLDRILRYTNLIVVMVNTDNAFYTNTNYGVRYYDAIVEELPRVLKRFFPNMSTKREKTFIAGLSMGGYGAFKLALSTNRFSYAASFSGALYIEGMVDALADRPEFQEKKAFWQGIFGDLSHPHENPNTILNIAKDSDRQTKLYAWCGEGDYLYGLHQIAVKKLSNLGLDLEARHSPGTHEWYYWEKQLEIFLQMLPIDFKLEERLGE
ncbi:alpha/beta hydrolase [Streptococcus sp. DD13]|uniref:alpha/beta hydrolase n=1 Tax=Streptococcus sp. DD13 TaxID=1777881 RepID=UPI0007978337|nr:alpha/beta hydrolase family protein [Streptococcus sp. DD13]KXT79052.1 Tributyrin esterase [Streptococcus sp. DD13]